VTRRNEQYTAELTRAVQEVLVRGLQDPRVSGLITVTGVKVTEDLRDATVSVSVLPAEKQELTLHGLQGAAAYIRREVGERMDARRIPTLNFRLETGLKKEAGVIRALAQAAAEREKANPGGVGSALAPEDESGGHAP
jgi:ribosome-binding factor A